MFLWFQFHSCSRGFKVLLPPHLFSLGYFVSRLIDRVFTFWLKDQCWQTVFPSPFPFTLYGASEELEGFEFQTWVCGSYLQCPKVYHPDSKIDILCFFPLCGTRSLADTFLCSHARGEAVVDSYRWEASGGLYSTCLVFCMPGEVSFGVGTSSAFASCLST